MFAVNVLAEHAEFLSRHFARHIPDKFTTINYQLGQLGVPLLADALTRLECRLVQQYPGGDHSIFIGEVVATSTLSDSQPLLYFRSQYGQFYSNTSNLVSNVAVGASAPTNTIS